MKYIRSKGRAICRAIRNSKVRNILAQHRMREKADLRIKPRDNHNEITEKSQGAPNEAKQKSLAEFFK